MQLEDGIVVSNRMLWLTIYHFGNSLILWNKRKDSFELVSFKIKEDIHHHLNKGDNHARILRIVNDYANRGRINYFWSIAHNIDFWEHFQIFFIMFVLFPWDL